MDKPKMVGVETLRAILKSRHSSRGIMSAVKQVAQEQLCNKDHRYNGWPNYETWNVALWLDNDAGSDSYWNEAAQECYDAATADKTFTREERATLDLCDRLKSEIEDQAETMLSEANLSASMFADLLNGALSEVDWYRIAETYLESVDKVDGPDPSQEAHSAAEDL